jgi:hypothetical protein
MFIVAVLVCSMAPVIAHIEQYTRLAIVATTDPSPQYDATAWIDEKLPPSSSMRVCDRDHAWNTDRPLQFKVRVHPFVAGYPRRLKVRQVYG